MIKETKDTETIQKQSVRAVLKNSSSELLCQNAAGKYLLPHTIFKNGFLPVVLHVKYARYDKIIGDYSFSTSANFFEKLTFLTP